LAGLSHDNNWLEESSKLFEPSTNACSESEDRERDLIRRDVGRSVLFHHSCPSPNSVMGSFDEQSMESKAELSTKRLAAVLTAVISVPLSPNDDKPHYYQGLHDLGGVLLENLEYDEVLTTAILRNLCRTHLRDNTKATFEDVKWFLNSCLMKVLGIVDPPVYQALVECGLDALLPMTLVKWLFTWFTHSIHGEEEASRFVDAFIASHPLMPFYVSIAFLVHPRLRTDILTADLDDPSSMNMAIQNLPSQVKSDWKPEGDTSYVTTQELIDTAISIM
jgi:Rab-GTPase-TBC domain